MRSYSKVSAIPTDLNATNERVQRYVHQMRAARVATILTQRLWAVHVNGESLTITASDRLLSSVMEIEADLSSLVEDGVIIAYHLTALLVFGQMVYSVEVE